ncbi:uncharacterized protein CCOS01_03667 [Colletotrichum costaricense]|uniref:Uncharacterized protein n=1 Tax=Colletotrichum costaricense TaxID=1209916 RepID=A0AAI9Z723_9PEZI|nr:uncharacterized protein CCOS01_03667 [Colletotrichum costaricense]KAK1534915.1 hypothetical protein CCOS01_03667 [Colletotrichum costaricense]
MASRKMTLGHCLFVDSLSTVRGQARPGHPVALSPWALALMNPPAVFPLASDIHSQRPREDGYREQAIVGGVGPTAPGSAEVGRECRNKVL